MFLFDNTHWNDEPILFQDLKNQLFHLNTWVILDKASNYE